MCVCVCIMKYLKTAGLWVLAPLPQFFLCSQRTIHKRTVDCCDGNSVFTAYIIPIFRFYTLTIQVVSLISLNQTPLSSCEKLLSCLSHRLHLKTARGIHCENLYGLVKDLCWDKFHLFSVTDLSIQLECNCRPNKTLKELRLWIHFTAEIYMTTAHKLLNGVLTVVAAEMVSWSMSRSGLSVDQAACTAASVPLASCTGLQGVEWRALFSVLFSEKGSAVEDRYSITKTFEKLDCFD